MDKAFEIKPGTVTDVPLTLVDLDPNQPRKDVDEAYIAELSADIKASQVKQPITLRANPEQPGRFIIKYGECRYRASKKAKKKNIPALLDDSKTDELTLLLDQAKENHLRKDLNPMDWAWIFKQMKESHKLKIADIEKTLKSHHVGQFGRAYISNIMRMVELPEWAQVLIRKDVLTAAHGKYLLQANASDKVIAKIQGKFEHEDWQPTTRELQQEIYWTYAREHTELTGWQTSFNYKEKCNGCQKKRKASASNGIENTFCMDKKCYAKFNSEAKSAQQEERESHIHRAEDDPVTVQADENNCVDVDQLELNWMDFKILKDVSFDISGCEGCPHRHIAKWTEELPFGEDSEQEPETVEKDSCFHRSCFDKTSEEHRRAMQLVEQYIREQIASQVQDDSELATGLLIWTAAGCPCGVHTSDHGGEYIDLNPADIFDEYGEDEADTFEKLLFSRQLTSFSKFAWEESRAFQDLAQYAVHKFHQAHLIELIPHFNLNIDNYRIDANYLGNMTEEQIRVFLEKNEFNLPPGHFAEIENAKGLSQLINAAINAGNSIGVPSEIRWAFHKLTDEE